MTILCATESDVVEISLHSRPTCPYVTLYVGLRDEKYENKNILKITTVSRLLNIIELRFTRFLHGNYFGPPVQQHSVYRSLIPRPHAVFVEFATNALILYYANAAWRCTPTLRGSVRLNNICKPKNEVFVPWKHAWTCTTELKGKFFWLFSYKATCMGLWHRRFTSNSVLYGN